MTGWLLMIGGIGVFAGVSLLLAHRWGRGAMGGETGDPYEDAVSLKSGSIWPF